MTASQMALRDCSEEVGDIGYRGRAAGLSSLGGVSSR
ncbi:hypothetical protein Cadr_000014825 [Camelus dromedarius]|uniref:Uncharacterized protein n=1 Tax=Camelus dromedarius TaxID=9838 RepID=A0A5N4DNP2_CAMDR|nr:hypothetical protein Cadr_000014825 [Camelus dromedarius]